MSEETLSALLDGECSAEELDRVLQRLGRDPALRERFSRLSRARDLRRGRVSRPVPADFANRVMAGLPARPDGFRRPALRWRPVAALAAAAAFAALAVLVLRPETTPRADQATVVAGQGAPGAVAAVPATMVEDRDFARLDDANARQLRNYLMAYSQSRAKQGMGGTLGYARYAAYSEGRQVEQEKSGK